MFPPLLSGQRAWSLPSRSSPPPGARLLISVPCPSSPVLVQLARVVSFTPSMDLLLDPSS